jgi:8-oxo-dGTP pyrophosphatase MutT (NUDIX family)
MFESRLTLETSVSKEQLLEFPAFKAWQNTLKSSLASQYSEQKHPFKKDPYTLRSVTVQSVDYFGPEKIGFVKINADVRNSKGEYLPGIAFLRGGSVAMLMILRPSDSKNERWVVMTEQARIPAGSLRFMEIPAGMMDKSGTFAGAAAKEIKEETGLEVKEKELIDLTQLALQEAGVSESLQQAMYPSPGGSDEFIAIFLWEKVLDRQEIEDLRDKLTGLRSRGEKITVRLLDYEDLWKVGARDAKTLAAWSLYEALKRARHEKLLDERIW